MENADITKTLMEIQKDVSSIKTDTVWIKKQLKTICADQKESENRLDDVESWKNKVNGALIILGVLVGTFGVYVVSCVV